MTDCLRWTIGDVTITRLQELELAIPFNPAWPFLPDATPEALAALPDLCPRFVTPDGALRLSFHALLVDAPGLRLVVDTCIGNDRAHSFLDNIPLQTSFLEDLCALGWSPDTVDMVMCTHMHVDHVGWNTRLVDGQFVPTFPRAHYCFARSEFEHFYAHLRSEDMAFAADSIRPIVEAGLVMLVDEDHRLSPEISLRPTPGHTIGHVSIVIESRGMRAIISGDSIHHPCQMLRPHWMTTWEHDAGQALTTRLDLLEDLAQTDDLLIGTHFADPTAGHVDREGDAYRFRI
jgi:glyoxylase-like metal-dependent hydrolase (beta-lactamase superfamily II)